jgi:hypothetical protein
MFCGYVVVDDGCATKKKATSMLFLLALFQLARR